MIKKIFSMILILSFAFFAIPFSALIVSANDSNDSIHIEDMSEIDNNYNKIHFYFNEEAHTTIDDNGELSSALSVLKNDQASRNASTTEKEDLYVTVEFESDFMSTKAYQMFSLERDSIDDSQDVLDFRKRLNAYSKEYHANLVEKNLKLLSNLNYQSVEAIEYSPFVTLTIDSADLTVSSLKALSDSSLVENISLSYQVDAKEEDVATWKQTLSGVNAYSIVNSGQYTGENVRIGIFEAKGICDTSHVNLADKNITIRDSSVAVSDHATSVTSVAALIAPDAEFFVSKTGASSEGISWFIDNYCDVVNCSFGRFQNYENPDGTYSVGLREYRYDIDAVYDYQILAHFITVCASSGNKNTNETSDKYNPDSKITSPGYAYNVITVGGVERMYEDFEYRWMHAEGASYKSNDFPVKPNISAPFHINIPKIGTTLGTSFSSPIAAASVAILMGCKPSYAARPDRVMSVLTSTAQKTYDYSATNDFFDEKVGAGILDLDAAIESYQYVTQRNTNTISQTEIISEEVELTAGTEIQIALSWLVTVNISSQNVYCTDYHIKLYGSSGSEASLVDSCMTDTNVQFIRYTVPFTNTYRIAVYQDSAMNSNVTADFISLTYTIYGDNVGHVHCYEGEYESIDNSKHKRWCYCGQAYIEQEHDWVSVSDSKMRCVDCNLLYIGGSVPGGTIQSTGNNEEIYAIIIDRHKYV